jgi:ABC-type transporter MlaC component
MVITYRDTFENQVHEHGVDGLIKSLDSKNRSLEPQAGAKSK